MKTVISERRGGGGRHSILFGQAAGWRVLTSLHSGHPGGPLAGPGGSQACRGDGPRGDPVHLWVGMGEVVQSVSPVRYSVLPTKGVGIQDKSPG